MVDYEVMKKKYDDMIKSRKYKCEVCGKLVEDERLIKIFEIVKRKAPDNVFPEFHCEKCLIEFQKKENKENFKPEYSVDDLLEDLEKDSDRFYMKGGQLAYRSRRQGVWGRIKV